MKIAVIGTGYVGLVAGACFSSFNLDVICIDQDIKKIENLKLNILPIYEPGLEEIIEKSITRGNLKFTSDFAEANNADIIIIAVGTPSLPSGEADLSYLVKAIDDTIEMTSGKKTLIIKSTVPIGTAKKIRTKLPERFHLISNPEFLREGIAIHDFLKPDRIIIGIETKKAREVAKALYHPLISQDVPLLFTDNTTAETIKYTANAYLAMRIAYINQMADLCEEVGASIDLVAKGIGMDRRIGRRYLHAGPGYGGSCFPKDTNAISYLAASVNVDLSIVNAVIKANEDRKYKLAARIIQIFKSHKCTTIAVLGLTFKADTDDMRDSASLVIVPELMKAGFTLKCYDPAQPESAKRLLNINLMHSLNDAIEGVDGAIIITEWAEFQMMDLSKLSGKVLYDLRNVFELSEVKDFGLTYYSIGRPNV